MKNYNDLLTIIEKASEEGIGLDAAEKAAGTALMVMNSLSEDLKEADKDRRMRKRGVKAIRSAIRMEEIKKHDKKPTEGALEDTVNTNSIVASQEESFDNSEVFTEELERQFGIAKESHLWLRAISKGAFNG